MAKRKKPSSATIVPIERRRSVLLEKTLQDLLEQARSGELKGLLFVAKYGQTDFIPGAAGDYARDPVAAVGAASILAEQCRRWVPRS